MNWGLNSDFTVINHEPLGKSCNLSTFQGFSPIKRRTVTLTPKSYREDKVLFWGGSNAWQISGNMQKVLPSYTDFNWPCFHGNTHINSLPAGRGRKAQIDHRKAYEKSWDGKSLQYLRMRKVTVMGWIVSPSLPWPHKFLCWSPNYDCIWWWGLYRDKLKWGH